MVKEISSSLGCLEQDVHFTLSALDKVKCRFTPEIVITSWSPNNEYGVLYHYVNNTALQHSVYITHLFMVYQIHFNMTRDQQPKIPNHFALEFFS